MTVADPKLTQRLHVLDERERRLERALEEFVASQSFDDQELVDEYVARVIKVGHRIWLARDRARFESWLRHRPPNPTGGRPPTFRWYRVVHGRPGKRQKDEDAVIVADAVSRFVRAHRRGKSLHQTEALIAALEDAGETAGGSADQVKNEIGGRLFTRLKVALNRAIKAKGLSRA